MINSAGISCALLLRIEAVGFPTFGLLLYTELSRLSINGSMARFGRWIGVDIEVM